MKTRLLNTNEHLESINSLLSLREQLFLLDLKVYRWKWIIIILHNCLQNFMVCCLNNSNYLNTLSKEDSARWYNYLLAPFKPTPKIKLDTCLNLFDKIQTSDMLINSQSKSFMASSEHRFAVIKLNELRNNFIHFIPKEWTIVIDGLPNIVKSVIEIIEFLVFSSGNYKWRNEKEKIIVKNAINDIREKLVSFN